MRPAFVALLWALLWAHPAVSETVVLSPSEDVYTSSQFPDSNFVTEPVLRSGKVYYPLRVWRTYMVFDVSAVQGEVEAARLRLYQFGGPSGAGGLDGEIHRVIEPWSADAITWANSPEHSTMIIDEQPIGDWLYYGWITWDVTYMVSLWVAGLWPNYGFVLKIEYEQAVGAPRCGRFYSSEYTITWVHPVLEIDLGGTPVEARAWGNIKALYR